MYLVVSIIFSKRTQLEIVWKNSNNLWVCIILGLRTKMTNDAWWQTQCRLQLVGILWPDVQSFPKKYVRSRIIENIYHHISDYMLLFLWLIRKYHVISNVTVRPNLALITSESKKKKNQIRFLYCTRIITTFNFHPFFFPYAIIIILTGNNMGLSRVIFFSQTLF